MVGFEKIFKELIVVGILGAVYLIGIAPIVNSAVANYTGGGDLGATLGTLVGMLQILVVALAMVGIALKGISSK